MLLYPDYYFSNIYDIPDDFFTQNKYKTILMDIDGTLVSHDSTMVSPRLWEWVDNKKEMGIKVVLVSNNTQDRVEKFASTLDVPFYFDVKKPCQKILKVIKQEFEDGFCLIGDQIFTDILGGNFAKMTTVLVDTIDTSDIKGFAKFVRKIEKPFRKVKKKQNSKEAENKNETEVEMEIDIDRNLNISEVEDAVDVLDDASSEGGEKSESAAILVEVDVSTIIENEGVCDSFKEGERAGVPEAELDTSVSLKTEKSEK